MSLLNKEARVNGFRHSRVSWNLSTNGLSGRAQCPFRSHVCKGQKVDGLGHDTSGALGSQPVTSLGKLIGPKQPALLVATGKGNPYSIFIVATGSETIPLPPLPPRPASQGLPRCLARGQWPDQASPAPASSLRSSTAPQPIHCSKRLASPPKTQPKTISRNDTLSPLQQGVAAFAVLE